MRDSIFLSWNFIGKKNYQFYFLWTEISKKPSNPFENKHTLT